MKVQIHLHLRFIVKANCFLFFLFFCNESTAQCDSSYLSITTTTNQQTFSGLTVTLTSPTNAQSIQLLNGGIRGYFLGDENVSEAINFSFSQPVRKIKIICRALSAAYGSVEYFSLKVNGQHHKIQPNELVTPDPAFGERCFLQPNGSILGDTVGNGSGSFILTYENVQGIDNFQINDSILSLNPNGAVFDVQIYTKCNNDTGVVTNNSTFFIPTAFTPNSDGKNDIFKPIISGNLKKIEFRIFDRWGQNIFSTMDHWKGWDGTNRGEAQDQGVFVWICHYQFVGQELQTRKGNVFLIR